MCGFDAWTTLSVRESAWEISAWTEGRKEGSIVVFQRLDISLWRREDVDGDDGLGFRWDFARGRWVMNGVLLLCERIVRTLGREIV